MTDKAKNEGKEHMNESYVSVLGKDLKLKNLQRIFAYGSIALIMVIFIFIRDVNLSMRWSSGILFLIVIGLGVANFFKRKKFSQDSASTAKALTPQQLALVKRIRRRCFWICPLLSLLLAYFLKNDMRHSSLFSNSGSLFAWISDPLAWIFDWIYKYLGYWPCVLFPIAAGMVLIINFNSYIRKARNVGSND